ncbi:MAG: hypothetical protein QOE34_1274 [Verrucomicrobiota bacterium]
MTSALGRRMLHERRARSKRLKNESLFYQPVRRKALANHVAIPAEPGYLGLDRHRRGPRGGFRCSAAGKI